MKIINVIQQRCIIVLCAASSALFCSCSKNNAVRTMTNIPNHDGLSIEECFKLQHLQSAALNENIQVIDQNTKTIAPIATQNAEDIILLQEQQNKQGKDIKKIQEENKSSSIGSKVLKAVVGGAIVFFGGWWYITQNTYVILGIEPKPILDWSNRYLGLIFNVKIPPAVYILT